MERLRDVYRFKAFVAGMTLSCFAALGILFSALPQEAVAKGAQKRVELILDASGSMTGLLKSGESKIDAAKQAVETLVKGMSPETILAFRAYGHQSHRTRKDCKDTQLLVNFAPVSEKRDQVISKAKVLKAQGYTPITYVLKLAAEDFPKKADEERIIILVSDGKETCEGDPCATALALVKSGISRLIIHTVGFGVDDATRGQLECIARVTGGRYFSASSANELAEALGRAVETAPVKETETVVVIKKKGPGFLKIIGPDLSGHDVIDAETGKKVAWISTSRAFAEVKPGIYNVTVGGALWKSVEVKPGETTVLKPGWLTVAHAWINGHDVLDPETGMAHGSVSNLHNSIALMPGFYEVTFGKATWPVEIKEGEKKLLKPGIVEVVNPGVDFRVIRNHKGEEVGAVSNSQTWMPLPPGQYTLEIDEEKYAFSLKEGETKKFKIE
jgi:hypothetical protein